MGAGRWAAHPFGALNAGPVEIAGGEEKILWTRLCEYLYAPSARLADDRCALARRDVKDHHRLIEKFAECDQPREGFRFREPRMADGMVLRGGVTPLEQT